MQIKIGDVVPLSLKLFDQDPGQQVRALIYSNRGDLLSDEPLYHLDLGLYLSSAFQMPDVESIVAVYTVKDSEKYADASEVFVAIKPEPKFLVGKVMRKTTSDFVKGFVYEVKNLKRI